jgi:hypothetical protein
LYYYSHHRSRVVVAAAVPASLDMEKLDTNKFKTLDEVPDEYRIQITDERVCDICRDNFEANLRKKDRFELEPGGFGPKLLDK